MHFYILKYIRRIWNKRKKRARINICPRNDYDVSHYIMIMSFYFLNTHDLQTGTLRILSIIYFTQFLHIMLSASKTNPSKTFNWDLSLQKYVSIVHFNQCNQISRIPDFQFLAYKHCVYRWNSKNSMLIDFNKSILLFKHEIRALKLHP